MQVAAHAKTGQNHDLTRKLVELFPFTPLKAFIFWTTSSCKAMSLTGYSMCQLLHIPKKDITFYQLHQENFKNDMVAAIVLALQFNTDKRPRALFHLKLFLAEPE